MIWLAVVACVLALIPACMFLRNLSAYKPPPAAETRTEGVLAAVSVLIPARNEADSIQAAIAAVLASPDVILEVIVLDDHSSDATASIVRHLAVSDPRLHLVSAPPLPPGWCGKQHACALLARLATHPLLLFVDADVRLAPDAIARLAAFLELRDADLVSGVPRQETCTMAERLVIPLVHFLLLGFLPLRRMRTSRHAAYGAGCGQLVMCRRAAYEAVGGHAVIRTSLHDGLTLPRAFRRAGYRTDLCDATALATCRMYRNFKDLWQGLAKNATEGLAAPAMIVPATLFLLGGQVAPVVILVYGLLGSGTTAVAVLASIATLTAYCPRLCAWWRFQQSLRGALLHPCGMVLLLAIQGYAWARRLLGHPTTWKGRPYPTKESAVGTDKNGRALAQSL